MTVVRRIRGALGIAAFWGLGFAAWSALVSLMTWIASPTDRRFATFRDQFAFLPRATAGAAAQAMLGFARGRSSENRSPNSATLVHRDTTGSHP